MKTNPLKGEYFLPSVVSELLAEDKADVKSPEISGQMVWRNIQRR